MGRRINKTQRSVGIVGRCDFLPTPYYGGTVAVAVALSVVHVIIIVIYYVIADSITVSIHVIYVVF